MASSHVAGAAALLASQSEPTSRAAVLSIRDSLVAMGNDVWDNSDDGDAIKEPLLDVSNSSVFSPQLVVGAAGGTTADSEPAVDLKSPAANATLTEVVTSRRP